MSDRNKFCITLMITAVFLFFHSKTILTLPYIKMVKFETKYIVFEVSHCFVKLNFRDLDIIIQIGLIVVFLFITTSNQLHHSSSLINRYLSSRSNSFSLTPVLMLEGQLNGYIYVELYMDISDLVDY